ncbi:MAG: putative 7-carboxy-7-deazaguanine synthase QueE [Clostridia bacterium]|nr:putative 7-carboxy-7-deazaguanine synthase QueE [Clostridia bacterium]
MAEFKVAETFDSINGEGMKSGQLAFFVRFAGCNMNCTYCDTMWANEPENRDNRFRTMSTGEIYSEIKLSGIRNVTLTGGEPLIQPHIDELLDVLLEDERLTVEIETNGSVDLTPFIKPGRRRPVFTVDYKLPSSGNEILMRMSNFDLLEREDTVKFVASGRTDLERAATVIDAYDLPEKCHVLISPVYGQIQPLEIVDFMKENKLNGVGLQIQLHKLLWGAEAKGV